MLSLEDTYAGLFALVSDLPDFETTSRTFRSWTAVPPGSQPALFQRQQSLGVSQQQNFGLPKYTYRAWWWIYAQYSPDSDTTPVTLLNSLVEKALSAAGITRPDGVPFEELQTLGGLVTNAWTFGEILFNEGVLPSDSQSIAVIPLVMITGV